MTPKARRQQQLTRESATRNETEAAIAVFKTGQRRSRATRLLSSRRTRKHAARCYGCDVTGVRLSVWEYEEVESGPTILCEECAAVAEASFRASRAKQARGIGEQRPDGVIRHRR
jgi:hypothetical protein